MNYEQIIKQYKSYIASSYISLTPEQINILPESAIVSDCVAAKVLTPPLVPCK